MQYNRWVLFLGAAVMFGLSGCVSVKAPESIQIGSERRPEPVDSSRVPNTASHEEAREELRKAYANLRYYEDELAELQDKAERYKRERERCEDELEECEERLERYTD
jgi:predicted RNase H-like nuclease (RuvC/YqgF family)